MEATNAPVSLSANAIRVLESRYLIRNESGDILESPEDMFRRVAAAVADAETTDDAKEVWREKFFALMAAGDFLPNSPTLMNAGRELGLLSACFVLPVEDNTAGIFKSIADTATIQKAGGGTGFAFDTLRPCGAFIKSSGGTSSGPISFWRVFSEATSAIQQGSFRRGANMAIMSVYHPDIIKFLYAKQDLKQFTNYNISVKSDDAFMDDVKDAPNFPLIVTWEDSRWLVPRNIVDICEAAVRQGRDGEKHPRELDTCYSVSDLIPVPEQITDRDDIRAFASNRGVLSVQEVMDIIVRNAWQTGEPGLFFINRIRETEATPAVHKIEACNPCVTGETLVAVADGRGCVPIQQLAAEGCDVLVHCVNPENGEAHVRMGRKPRKTREQVPVFKVTLDDGSSIRVSDNHKFLLRDGSKVMTKDLKAGDSLMRFSRYQQPNSTTGKMYWYVMHRYEADRRQHQLPEHNMICRAAHGEPYGNQLPHHRNEDTLDNCPDNLEWLSIQEHNLQHPQICERAGENNPRFGTRHTDATKELIGYSTRTRFADKDFRQRHAEATRAGVTPEARAKISEARQVDKVLRICEICSKEDWLLPCRLREHSRFCSKRCANTRAINKDTLLGMGNECADKCGSLTDRKWNVEYRKVRADRPDVKVIKRLFGSFREFKEEVLAVRNHKVVSVEADGVEDVFNITVDEFHTVAYVTCRDGKTRLKGYPAHHGIYTPQCGEQPLMPHEACNLGSLNLSHFVTPFYESKSPKLCFVQDYGALFSEKFTAELVDWDRLRAAVYVAVRLLDNVVTINNYPTPEIDHTCRSNRKIGLGIMGFADALIRLGVRYDSEAGLYWGERLMKFITDEAVAASQALVEERGTFRWFDKNSRWETPMRNACVTTVAPTGTISIIADCSCGIEPWFSFVFIRQVLSDSRGETKKLPQYQPDLQRVLSLCGVDSDTLLDHVLEHGTLQGRDDVPDAVKEIFRSARDIAPTWHVLMQAAFQKHVTSAVSKTVNLPANAERDEIKSIYLAAHQHGCKGVTVYRDGCREGQPMTLKPAPPRAEKLPVFRHPVSVPDSMPANRCRHKTTYGNLHMHVSFEATEDGRFREREVFFHLGRSGDGVHSTIEAFGRLCSVILRLDCPIDVPIEQLHGHASWGEKTNGRTGAATSLPSELALGLLDYYRSTQSIRDEDGLLLSLPGYAACAADVPQAVETARSQDFIRKISLKSAQAGTLCQPCPTPGCDGQLVHAEGCSKCLVCGEGSCG